MKIAIVGATGMLGQHTALAAQAAGHDLTILHRASSDLSKLAISHYRSVEVDLDGSPETLAAAITGHDIVINCAGYYPTQPRAWREDVRLATQSLNNFFTACHHAHAQQPLHKIVYLGAAIALQTQAEGLGRPRRLGRPGRLEQLGDETCEYPQQPQNKNPYLQCKWAMDQLSMQWANTQPNLPVSIAIPSMTFGEYDAGPSTGQLITKIANQTLPAYVQGKRNVIYAGDAGRGIVRVAEDGRVGERYLLTGHNTNMDELVSTIAQITQQPAAKPAPLWVAKLLNRWQTAKYHLTGTEPTISSTAIAVMSAGQHLSGEKAATELNFAANASMSGAIQKAYDWFQQAGYIEQN